MIRPIVALGFWLAAVAAHAQSTSPVTPPGAGGSNAATPTPAPDKGITAGPSTGVIRPGNPDPAMAVSPPSTGLTPVVPPPGTAGNNPTVVPK